MSAGLRGAPNFRDLGGLCTRTGRQLAAGRILRSGQIGELHAEDLERLATGLGTDLCVVDLRGDVERTRLACVLPDAVVHSLPIEPRVARRLDAAHEAGQPLDERLACEFMDEAYRHFVRHAQPQAARFFSHVIEREGRPLIVHCTAGKDRTGFMVALLLLALDVPRETIFEDYLLTNQRVQPKDSARYPAEVMQVLGTVRAGFLQAALDEIDQAFGDADRYLERAVGLTPARRERLRVLLLNP